MRLSVALVACALSACGAVENQPHDMGDPVPDLTVIDLSPPRDGPVATVNVPGGCSGSPARRLSASSRW